MPPDSALPTFENVRLATLSDVPRIASVAAAGFFWSPSFQFQRPQYDSFPDDTLSSYWREYETMIRDPRNVVLVAEDELDRTESGKVYAALRTSLLHRPGRIPETRIVVGVCSIVLKPGSPFIGQLPGVHCRSHVCSSEINTLLSRSKRDQSAEAVKLYGEATAPAKERYLAGQMRLGTLAVHPAYWRRGHATRLVSWCTQLADMEGTAVGVSATPMGATLAAKAGFEQMEIVRLRHTVASVTPKTADVALWIGVRPPSRSPSGASTVASDSPLPELRAL